MNESDGPGGEEELVLMFSGYPSLRTLLLAPVLKFIVVVTKMVLVEFKSVPLTSRFVDLTWGSDFVHLSRLLKSKMSFHQAFDLIFELDETTVEFTQDILRQRDCLDRLSKIPWVVPTFVVIEGEGTKPSDSKNELSLQTFSVMNESDGPGGEEELVLMFSGYPSLRTLLLAPVLKFVRLLGTYRDSVNRAMDSG
nr:hypothetical protein [Tanacetum cinerariifolium]